MAGKNKSTGNKFPLPNLSIVFSEKTFRSFKRATLYELLDPKRVFIPELSTVAAIIRALARDGVSTYAK